MALTVVNGNSGRPAQDVWGGSRAAVVDVTFDASYPTGGEPFTANQVGLAEFAFVSPQANDSGFVVVWDEASETLRVFGQEPTSATAGVIALSEVANAADLSALVVKVLVVGN